MFPLILTVLNGDQDRGGVLNSLLRTVRIRRSIPGPWFP